MPTATYNNSTFYIEALTSAERDLFIDQIDRELSHINEIINEINSPHHDNSESVISIATLEYYGNEYEKALGTIPTLIDIEKRTWNRNLNSKERKELYNRRDEILEHLNKIGINANQNGNKIYREALANLTHSVNIKDKQYYSHVSQLYNSQIVNISSTGSVCEKRMYSLTMICKQKIEENNMLLEQRKKQLEKSIDIARSNSKLKTKLMNEDNTVSIDIGILSIRELHSYMNTLLNMDLTNISLLSKISKVTSSLFPIENHNEVIVEIVNRVTAAIRTEIDLRKNGSLQPRPVTIVASKNEGKIFALLHHLIFTNYSKFSFGEGNTGNNSHSINYENIESILNPKPQKVSKRKKFLNMFSDIRKSMQKKQNPNHITNTLA